MKTLLLAGLLCAGAPATVNAQATWGHDHGQTHPNHPSEPSQVYVTTSMPQVEKSDYWVDFEALDRNGDGLLSRNEVESASPGRTAPKAIDNLLREFHVADANGDGYLERAEIPGWL